jgi:hypothetical protein
VGRVVVAHEQIQIADAAYRRWYGVKPGVAQIGHHVGGKFGVSDVLGRYPGTVTGSEHPLGLALDFMVHSDRARGDQIAAYVLAHPAELSVKYVIWKQRYNDGRGWRPMADRGSVTANHFDHVHVSFNSRPSGPEPSC